MKFTAEEMAYDPSPEETDKWLPIGRGLAAYEQFRRWKKQMIRLEPDVAKFFPDSASVNRALRKLLEAVPTRSPKRRKSA